jgi:hypothetical protein
MSSGRFGTLLIQLPSEFTGGDLAMRHDGRSITSELVCSFSHSQDARLVDTRFFVAPLLLVQSSNSHFTWKYAAFHSSVQSEFEPITSGYRLCLLYDLVQAPQLEVAPIKVPSQGWPDTYSGLQTALEMWSETTGSDEPKKFISPVGRECTDTFVENGRLPRAGSIECHILQQFNTCQEQLPGAITHLLTITCAHLPKEVLNLVFEYAPVSKGNHHFILPTRIVSSLV